MKNRKRTTSLLTFILVVCFASAAQNRKAVLRLTEKDRQAIIEWVFADGFEELNATLEKPNILNNCPKLLLHDEEVVFVSTRNIEPKLVPKIAGIHFEFMTPDEIKKAVQDNDRHCYFEFKRFEVVGSKVMIDFGKYLKRPVYIYGESFQYEFVKVSGKWQGKYIGNVSIES